MCTCESTPLEGRQPSVTRVLGDQPKEMGGGEAGDEARRIPRSDVCSFSIHNVGVRATGETLADATYLPISNANVKTQR